MSGAGWLSTLASMVLHILAGGRGEVAGDHVLCVSWSLHLDLVL
jgi:hypothetical protein